MNIVAVLIAAVLIVVLWQSFSYFYLRLMHRLYPVFLIVCLIIGYGLATNTVATTRVLDGAVHWIINKADLIWTTLNHSN